MRILKFILKIVLFPFVLLWKLIKLIFKQFNKIRIGKFLKTLSVSKLDALTGEEFENVCKLIFEYVGYQVKTTPASNDYGADLIITKKLTIVVQAKLYYKHGVGNHAVQEVTSALKFYKAHFAAVITNWKFTNQAQTMAQTQAVVLIDRQDLDCFFEDLENKTKTSKLFCLEKHFKANVKELNKNILK